MNAFSQDVASTGNSEILASRAAAIVSSRTEEVAKHRAARVVLFQDCLETALTSLVFLGCLLFAAAALRLGIAPCALRHWGVLSIYGVAVALAAGTVFAITKAIAKHLLQFKNAVG